MWHKSRALLQVVSVFLAALLPCSVVVLCYQDLPFWVVFSLVPLLGLVLHWRLRSDSFHIDNVPTRDGYLLLLLSWLLLSLVAAVPFWCGGGNISWWDAWFIAVSGLTTTGAEVLRDPQILPRSLLFYRMYLQFLGGLGVVVMAAVWWPDWFAHAGRNVDLPGSSPWDRSLAPRMSQSLRIIWLGYLLLWVSCVLGCYALSLTWFEAVCESFAMVSTGGFGLYADNIGHYHSPGLNILVMVVVLLSSIGFGLHYTAIHNNSLAVYLRSREFCCYVLTLLLAAFGYLLWAQMGARSPLATLFSVVAMLSTSGHSVVQQQWPAGAVFGVMLLSFIGGCAGSTAGGIKVRRCLYLWRDFVDALTMLLHPQVVLASNDGSGKMQVPVVIRGFLLGVLLLGVVFFWLLLLLGLDGYTAIMSLVACFSNTGNAWDVSFVDMSFAVKLCLLLAMLIGRMEVMVVMLVFYRGFWSR